MALKLKKHQRKAIENLHNGAILVGDVGSGKSIAVLAYYYVKLCGGTILPSGEVIRGTMTKRRDVYVITTAKKRDSLDWEADALKLGISNKTELSDTEAKITVDSWNNIEKYVDMAKKDPNKGEYTPLFIFDEQRLVGSGAWVKSFLKIAKNHPWVLLSATPGDVWIDYLPVFMANGFFRTRQEFIDEHVVYSRYAKFPKIQKYINQPELERLRESISVEMPFSRHTVRNQRSTPVHFDADLLKRVVKERWHVYDERPLRDIAELISVSRRVVNTDASRIAAIRELLQKHPRLIIFYNFNYELDILRTLRDDGIQVAEWNGHKHEPVPGGDAWAYLVQYSAGAEAWNCITTNAVAFYSLNYSYRMMEQCRGRIDRMNTPYTDLYYYTLRSLSPIDAAIMKSLRAKKDFNEREFAKEL